MGVIIRSTYKHCLLRKDYHHRYKAEVSENTPTKDTIITPLPYFPITIDYDRIQTKDLEEMLESANTIFFSIYSRKKNKNKKR